MSATTVGTQTAPLVVGRHTTLALLTLVATFNIFDKALFQVMADPIKREFALSDTQVGLLGGLTFGLFFALGGIPFGMMADRFNRRNLLAACLAFWSLVTLGCGVAVNFVMLLACRSMVGAGEAGSGPSAMSMISDLFPQRERATATAIYNIAVPLGSGLSLTLGGWAVQAIGWRQTLISAGVAGIVLALIVLVTVREPLRRNVRGLIDSAVVPPLGKTLLFILGQRALLHVAAALVLIQVAINGYGMWMFAFFTRFHGLSSAAAGLNVTLAILPASIIAMVGTAALADRLAKRDVRWWVWLPALVVAFAFPASYFAVTADTVLGGLIGTGLWMFAATAWYGAGYGISQSLVEPRMRATIMAILLMLTALLGFGLGPLFAGMISDYMAPTAGARSIAYGMVGTSIFAVWSALHFALAARHLKADLKRVAG